MEKNENGLRGHFLISSMVEVETPDERNLRKRIEELSCRVIDRKVLRLKKVKKRGGDEYQKQKTEKKRGKKKRYTAQCI